MEHFHDLKIDIEPVLSQPNLRHYATPTHEQSFWPYLVTEFKAYRTGIEWVAENQNATAGACCVTAVERLLSLAYPQRHRRVTDSMAFSCVINSARASIWVHWFTTDTVDHLSRSHTYMSAPLEEYRLGKTDQALAFRTALLNITDWALGDRLTTIQKALVKLVGAASGESNLTSEAAGVEQHTSQNPAYPGLSGAPTDDTVIENDNGLQSWDAGDALPCKEESQLETEDAHVSDRAVSPPPWTSRLEGVLRVCGRVAGMF